MLFKDKEQRVDTKHPVLLTSRGDRLCPEEENPSRGIGNDDTEVLESESDPLPSRILTVIPLLPLADLDLDKEWLN